MLLEAVTMKKASLKKILVPVDFSAMSTSAIETAQRLGKPFGAAIHLVHVHESYYPASFMASGAPVPMSIVPFREDAAPRIADELTALARKYGISAANCYIQNDTPIFNEICKVAQRIEADLIVMPTHGYTGVTHFFEGSTAERIVQHSPCPVYIAKRDTRSRKDASASKTSFRVDKILVPVDFSDCSLEGLKYAIQFADKFAAKILLLNAVTLGYAYAADGYSMMYDVSTLQDIAGKDAERQMREFVRRAQFGGVKFKTTVKIASPVDGICLFAEKQDVDLIIMSTHGRTGFKHVFIGSTAEQVVRRTKRPVLVVPSHPELRSKQLTEGTEVRPKARRKIVCGTTVKQHAPTSEKLVKRNLKPGAHPFPERRKTNKFRESHLV